MEKKKKWLLPCVIGAVIAVLVLIVILFCLGKNQKNEVSYRETEVYFGTLTVGVTEDGAISVGATSQTFDLDISAFVASGQSGSSYQSIWGNSPMNSFDFQTMALSSNGTRELVIETVYTAVGQQINEGDAICKLTDDSVDSIRGELQADVTDALLTLEQLKMSQKASRLSAEQTYETNAAYGAAAQREYDEKIEELTTAVTTAEKQLSDAQTELTEAQEKVAEAEVLYQKARQSYLMYVSELSSLDLNTNFWYFITVDNATDDAENTMNQLYDDYTALNETIQSLNEKIPEYQEKVEEARRKLATGKVEAKAAYDSRILLKTYAKTSYDVALSYLELDLSDAQEDYDEAEEKLNEFDAYVVDGEVLSEYTGKITGIDILAGDTLSTGSSLLSLYDWEDVTISADVEEEDISVITVGDTVNITLDAYEDTLFTGTVTEIGDAVTDSSTGTVTYTVTVHVEGDVSGLYEGMTGAVTFITKETRDVLYVSNRSIYREGTKSYVKVRNEDGTVVKKQVKTGFSDGVNVEITEGLEEGDIVLIESKVSES